jgi:hypothetical protein
MTDRHPGDMFQIKQRMPGYFRQELQRANRLLGDSLPNPKSTPGALPTIDGPIHPAGVRIILSLGENRLGHFRVPVVETVKISDDQRSALAYSANPRTIKAQVLQSWLAQIYPPAVMDGHGGMRSISGELTWTPAGRDQSHRFATLRGSVRFELDNRERISYQGPLDLVLSYSQDNDSLETLCGILQTRFPRNDQRGHPVERVSMTATLQSTPDSNISLAGKQP